MVRDACALQLLARLLREFVVLLQVQVVVVYIPVRIFDGDLVHYLRAAIARAKRVFA